MNFLKKIGILALTIFCGGLLICGQGAVLAQSSSQAQVCQGVNVDGDATCDDGGAVSDLIGTVITILSWVVGVIAVIMIVIGGLLFVTSAGEAEKAKKAKSTITYALIGIVVVALAQVMVRFVLKWLS